MQSDAAITHVLRFEGGYVNEPDDPGGETNFGISNRAYPDWEIKALTRQQAKIIYFKDYWLPLRCGRVPALLALPLLDAGVNQGVGAAVRMLQASVGVHTDGVLGPVTMAAVAGYGDVAALVDSFTLARIRRYVHIASKREASKKYLLGWVHRALTCLQLTKGP